MRVRSKLLGMLFTVGVAATLSVLGGGVAHATQVSAKSITPFAGAFNPIRNVGNGKCLQPASPADGSPIVQQTCVTDPNNVVGILAQGWRFQQVGTNHYQFLNQLSGECFDVFGPARNGTPLINGECKHISNEEFNTRASLPNVVALETRVGFNDNGFCIDVPGGQATDGLAMQVFRCNGTLAQRWVVGFPL
jgi:hypothetical protein